MFPDAWRYQRFHSSYLVASISAGVLVGLICGKYLVLTAPNTIAILAALVMAVGVKSARWWAIVLVACAGLVLGAAQGSKVHTDYQQYADFVGSTVQISGVVADDTQPDGNKRLRFTIARPVIDSRQVPGEVYVTVYGAPDIKRGDTVVVKGKLRDGFATYGATVSAGRILSYDRDSNTIRDVRERFATGVRAVVMEPMASLGLGFVIGQRSTLPDKLDEQLKVVGLTHIVVASGYNLTILVRFMMRLLSRHSRYLAFVSSLGMITLFVLFSGFSPSMNRAVVVTVLTLLAWYVGRRFHPVLLLVYVAAATAYFNPMYVWADLGWYLSFLAFAGVLVVAPLIVKKLYAGRRSPSSFEQLVIETMSAELMALPIIAFAFGAVPLFGLLANVLVAPFIPVAMVLTVIAGLVGMTGLSVLALLGIPVMILIGYMIAVVEGLGGLPLAQLDMRINLPLLLTWYGLVCMLCLTIQITTRYNFRLRDRQLEV